MPALDPAQRNTLLRYARDTWASLAALVDPDSGLPADSLCFDGTTNTETSITNIAAYMWSVLVATRLGLVGRAEAISRLELTLTTLTKMGRHWPSGQFYNWYSYRSGAMNPGLTPIISSVDNGWLATALHLVTVSLPELAAAAASLLTDMDFGCYYRAELNQIAVCYLPEDPQAMRCYDTIVSESRVALYVGIAAGQLPVSSYFGPFRAFPAHYDRARQKSQPVGRNRTYLGLEVFEGAYSYAGMRIVPGWGGSMFEALMPALFVPEERWGRQSWRLNHPLTVQAQIYHGLIEAGYGYWGFSPCATPGGGYQAYGVAAIGMNPSGYQSDGIVTPHASFLALRWAPQAALANLAKLEGDFPIYGEWGFRDSVDVRNGAVASVYLSLDQGIIMAAIGNALCHDMLRAAFVTPEMRAALEPVLALEQFNAAPRAKTAS
jgi:hypothetical protein